MVLDLSVLVVTVSAMSQKTATYAMADAIATDRLGYPLAAWVSDQRSEENRKSWQSISRTLHAETDGIVSVSSDTLRRWFKDAA